MSVIDRVSERQNETGLTCLHTGPVEDYQIDHLGHMNVRYYGVRAMYGTSALTEQLGLGAPGQDQAGARLAITDMFTRHYREQMEGEMLEVWSCVLDIQDTRLRFYHELFNPERDLIAATFVHTLQLQEPETRAPIPFSAELTAAAAGAKAPWPEHGHPRTIDLEREAVVPTLSGILSRGLENRKPREIQKHECDAEGNFKADDFPSLVWGGERLEAPDPDSDWLNDAGDGRRFGWATLESRGSLSQLPREGDRIQSFGAEIEIGRKTRHERYWVFNIDTEALLCTMSIVNVAFDVRARKAIEIPGAYRAKLQERFHPDLL